MINDNVLNAAIIVFAVIVAVFFLIEYFISKKVKESNDKMNYLVFWRRM